MGVLEPILTSQNILSISKLAPKIPEKDGSMLSPSSVYTIWLQKLFWNGDRKLIKKTPETTPEWLSAYDVCAKYFDRLYPGDIVTFLDDVTFSSKAVTKVNIIPFTKELQVWLSCLDNKFHKDSPYLIFITFSSREMLN